MSRREGFMASSGSHVSEASFHRFFLPNSGKKKAFYTIKQYRHVMYWT